MIPRDTHKGETCVIIGNGPSLDETPLEELANRYVTFGSNLIYRKPFYPDYYCLVDKLGLDTCLPLPDDFTSVRFMRAEAKDELNTPIYPITSAGFSLNINNFVVIGATVTYAIMQIAFHMGFATWLLVGVDHSSDHFECADGKEYFKEGVVYYEPNLTGVLKYYATAKDICDQTGRKIINLTPGTKENVFDKGTFGQWI